VSGSYSSGGGVIQGSGSSTPFSWCWARVHFLKVPVGSINLAMWDSGGVLTAKHFLPEDGTRGGVRDRCVPTSRSFGRGSVAPRPAVHEAAQLLAAALAFPQANRRAVGSNLAGSSGGGLPASA
jgi:hypothetical protein